MGKDYRAFIDNLCKSYDSALYQYAARRLRDDEIAKDLVQETFLLLVIRVSEIYTHENPAGWLFRVLGNLIQRELKKPYHQELPFASEEAALLSYTDEHFFQALPSGLTDAERELLTLRLEKNWDYETIADYLGITPDACRQRMSRTIRKCRELLHNEDT